MACNAPFYPNRKNYKTDREHNENPRKSWFLVLRAGLFTKKTDAQYQADASGSPVLTFRMRAEAEAHWVANCRKFHPHGRDEGENKGSEEHPRPSSPLPFSTPACSAPHSTIRSANAARASVEREPPVKGKAGESKAPLFRQDDEASPLSRTVPLFREDDEVSPLSRTVPLFRDDDEASPLSRTVPLFRDDDEVSPLSRTRKHPTDSVLPTTPGPDASPSHASPPSAGTSAGSISSVLSLSTSVGSSASRFVPPLRSLSRRPPSSKPAAPYLHAGSSASAGAGTRSRRHVELPVLFNNSTRTLYKDAATAVREMGKKDSVQVLEVEDLEEFLSAPPRAAT